MKTFETRHTERLFVAAVTLDHSGPDRDVWALEDEAAELEELAVSAGGKVAGREALRVRNPHPGTLLGSGQLERLQRAVEAAKAETVLFNLELTPTQQRNLEEHLRVKTLDRTQLILDVFAQRARSQEGKVQVELAQLRYLLPRLVGRGIELSRLGGGIGTRGPGEQKLEVDRRRIRQRIQRLTRDLEKLSSHREAIRKRRQAADAVIVALIGYTNAGKTTLLNRLTHAHAVAKNQLFTTLDPLARRVRLPGGTPIILIDTVGFLHHLPHHLVEAFKSTLEEAQTSDLLLHVVDAAHPLVMEHLQAVRTVLQDLGVEHKPIVTALNKTENMPETSRKQLLARLTRPSVCTSATTGLGVEELLAALEEQVRALQEPVRELFFAPEESLELLRLYQCGQVYTREDGADGVRVTARIPERHFAEFKAHARS